MLPELSVERLCGQLIIGGFEGAELPDPSRQALEDGRRAGVILFKRNLPSVDVAHELASAVLDAAPDELPPFIALDQEGGRVVRLPPPALRVPTMRAVGEKGDPLLARRVAAALGRELAALGFNLDFAPVLDVDSNPDNPVIGDRAFSADPDTVARFGRAFIEGLQSEGVMACGKHFPGHGDTAQDSHLDLPRVAHDKARLDAVELPPFRTASLRGVAAMMTAHVVYEELDPGVPATLSRRIVTGLLRGEIRFDGVLFSDDLEMRALADHWPIEDTAVRAVRAGCDCLLVCSSFELAERAHRALVERAEADSDFQRRCTEAVTRSLRARQRVPPRPLPSRAELAQVFDSAEARAVLVALGV